MNKLVKSKAKNFITKEDLFNEFPELKSKDVFILGITGSRLKNADKNYINRSVKFIEDTLNSIMVKKDKKIVIVEGGAIGVDTIVKDIGLKSPKVEMVIERLPKFEREKSPYNVWDYHTRNGEIVGVSDSVLAFWDGISTGTQSTIEKARKKKNLEAVFRLK